MKIYSWIYSFFYGLFLPFRATKLILKNRSLLLWSTIPFALTLAVSIYGVATLKTYLVGLGMHYLGLYGFAPESLTAQAAIILFKIVLFVLAAVSFSFLAGIIASPFNDFLAEATEPHVRPALPNLPEVSKKFSFRAKAIWIDIIKTIVVTGLQIFTLILAILVIWIPGLNVLLMCLTFQLLTFQFVSYPQTRRGEGLGQGLKFLWNYFFACAGFGATIGTLFALPFISGFALPIAVVGGTLLYGRAKDPVSRPLLA